MRWFKRKHVRSVVRRFWGTVILLVLVVAVCVQLGREAFPMLNDYRDAIAAQLSRRLGVEVEIGAIEAAWKGMHPRLELRHLVMRANSGAEILRVGQMEGELSLINSLREWQLVWRDLEFHQLHVQFEQTESGRWSAGGVLLARSDADEGPLMEDPLDIFLLARQLTLNDSTFFFFFHTGHSAELTVPQLELENEADFHRLVANFAVDGDREAFSVIVEGRGNPRLEESFTVEGHVALENFPMEKAVAVLDLPGWDAADSGEWSEGHRLDSRLWFRGNPYRQVSLQGRLRADGLPLRAPGNVKLPAGLRADVTGQWHADSGWRLALQDAEVSWDATEPPPLNLVLSGGADSPLQMAVDRIDMQVWLALAEQIGLSRGIVAEAARELAPQGQLSRLHLEMADLSSSGRDFRLRARIENGSLSPYRGAPAVQFLDGYVEASAEGGRVVIDSRQGFSMAFPQIYEEPFHYDTATGEVRWVVRNELRQVDVFSGLLSVSGEEGEGSGYLHLTLPYGNPERKPAMTLMVGLRDSHARFHRRYLPRTVPEDLYDWLRESVRDGHISDAGFLWHGSLVGENAAPRAIQLFGRVKGAALRFSPDWPLLQQAEGRLLLDNQYLDVHVAHAMLAGNRIERARVRLAPADGDESLSLDISGESYGQVDQLIGLLRESPFQNLLGDDSATWDAEGSYRADLDLTVPLHEDAAAGSQALRLSLQNAALQVPALPFRLEQIQGEVEYSSAAGLATDNLRLTVWGQPASLDLASSQAGGKPVEVVVSAETSLDAERLAEWADKPALTQFMGGGAAVKATATLAMGDSGQMGNGVELQLESDLVGLEIELPAPYGKSAEAARSLQLNGVLEGGLHYRLAYGDLLRLQFQQEGDSRSLSLAFGPHFAPLHAGYADFTGRLDRLDVSEWQAVLKQLQQGPGDGMVSIGEIVSLTPRIDMHVQLLQVEDLALHQLYFGGTHQRGRWQVDVNSPTLVGRVTAFDDERPMQINLQSLTLPQGAEGEAEANPPGGALRKVDLNRLPSLDFSTESVKSATRDWGAWSFRLRPMEDGIVLRDLRGSLLGLEIGAGEGKRSELAWLQTAGGNSTYLTTSVAAGDLASLLRELGQPELLENESADFDLELLWPGAPDDLDLEALEGEVGVVIRDGRFIRGAEAGNNPLLRLFGLLNFDTLARRLQLDFSDLYKEGMVFDSIVGEMRFRNGRLLVEKPLRVESPSSTLQFAGVLDANTEQIDASLVATLPVSGNLTIAAAFVGGLPAALGVFAVSKLFKAQVDQASSIRYRIRGAWDDPRVKVDRIFESATGRPDAELLPSASETRGRTDSGTRPPAYPVGQPSDPTTRPPPHQ